MKNQAFVFVGRYGSGKGTQAKLLMEALKKADPGRAIINAETGAEFRKMRNTDSFTAERMRIIYDRGDLLPVFMCVYAWGNVFVSQYTGNEHVVFDGTPRKLPEAQLLADVFPFYGMDKPWVIYLDVEHEESQRRITLRSKDSGRTDDTPEAVVRRRTAYETEVIPTIEWYRSNPDVRFLDIPGERSIEEIHADIVKRLGLE